MKKEKQEGLVFTNEKCIGCNKCISVCPVITANKAVDEDGKQIIQVDGDNVFPAVPVSTPVSMERGSFGTIRRLFLKI